MDTAKLKRVKSSRRCHKRALTILKQFGRMLNILLTIKFFLPQSRVNISKTTSLYNNDHVKAAMACYMVENKSTMTPKALKAHLENIIFPMLKMPMQTVDLKTISRWMKKEGWRFKRYRKGVYVDGHERADVVAYRDLFLGIMLELRKHMIQYHDETQEPLQNPCIEDGSLIQYVLVTHDECVFHSNDGNSSGWILNDEQPLRKKGLGKGLMVSDFLTDTIGRLALPEEEDGLLEAAEVFHFGGERYWKSADLLEQVLLLLFVVVVVPILTFKF